MEHRQVLVMPSTRQGGPSSASGGAGRRSFGHFASWTGARFLAQIWCIMVSVFVEQIAEDVGHLRRDV
eukprot:275957-Amphidinium_carterae.1